MDGAAAHLLALEDQPGEAAGSAKAAPKAMTAKSNAKSANPEEKQDALVDGTVELSLEETKAYTERQGKWRTDSALAVCDNIFVSVIADLCYRSREPLHYFFHWLQAPTQPREIDGDLRHPTKLADIVYFKAEEIRADLESLTESRRWVSTLGKVDPELRRPLSECTLTLTLLHLADFDKRIVHTFLDLTFCKRGAHIRDQGRVTLAEELLDTRPEKLQVTARKFVKMFRPELRSVVASGGVCPRTLWTQTAIWSETIPSDTQWIEGINKSIIQVVLLAPTIREPLLSSRVVLSTALSAGKGKVPNLNDVTAMVTEATGSFNAGEKLLEDIDRYATPPPRAPIQPPAIPIRPEPFPFAMMQWAKYHTAKLVKKLREMKEWNMRILLTLPRGSETVYRDTEAVHYVCPFLHGWYCHLCPCVIGELDGKTFFSVKRPLKFRSAAQVFTILRET